MSHLPLFGIRKYPNIVLVINLYIVLVLVRMMSRYSEDLPAGTWRTLEVVSINIEKKKTYVQLGYISILLFLRFSLNILTI